jgi:polyisoprenoid-binding protein YceI
MKNTLYIFASLVLAIGLTACSTEDETTTGPDEEPEVGAIYSYNEGTTELEWTSYKTSGKVPVAGSFNDIEVTSEEGSDPKAVMESISFSINTASVETNNEDRNGKIVEHFFQTINTPTIEGNVKSLGDNGKAVIAITMNSITFDVEGDYTLEDAAFSFTSTIDVSSWNGVSGIEALNTVCKDLHTGEDGISKLWSEIGLSFSTRLKVTP